MTIHINIGSNTGDRADNIFRAVNHIKSLDEIKRGSVKTSAIYQSEAMGFESENRFFNIAMSFDLKEKFSLNDLYQSLREIEKIINGSNCHRDAKGNYIDRILDIDIIAAEDIVLESTELILPHPRMHKRHFVLVPMSEIAPEWVHPILKKTTVELCNVL